MRDGRTLYRALFVAFAIWHASLSGVFFGCYVVAYFLEAESGVTLSAFLEVHGFVRFFLVSFTVAVLFATMLGVVAWIANRKGAKAWSRVERLIDAWVVTLGRSERDR